MSEEQLSAFLEQVKADTSLQDKLKAAASLKPRLKSLKQLGLQLPQKIFNQCNRQQQNCQTRSWKTRLVALQGVGARAKVRAVSGS